jgi:4-azaleucine resistance transporter AzlC
VAEACGAAVTSETLRSSAMEFRRGLMDILPIVLAAIPIGVLWGTLAVKEGLSPLETGLASATIFAGAAQFVAIDLWTNPAPWFLLTLTVFVVNLRHVLMGASLSRHLGDIPDRAHPLVMVLLVDEVWALAERRALRSTLTLPYYLGLGVPLLVNWTLATVIGAILGRGLGDPAAYGLDFAFSALFIAILAGFWKGSRTGAVLAVAAATAAITKLYVPGAWYIALGGVAGMLAGLLLAEDDEG